MKLRLLAILLLTACASTQATREPAEAGPARLRPDLMKALIRMKFPPQHSFVNCFSAALVGGGVATTLITHNGKRYFDEGCFTRISTPEPGDFGFIVWYHAPSYDVWHGFLYLGRDEVFQKGNPGWDEYPFEFTKLGEATAKYRLDEKGTNVRLEWRRYQPNPGCALTLFENWLNQNRADPRYSGAIAHASALAHGESKIGPRSAAEFESVVALVDDIENEKIDLKVNGVDLRDLVASLMHEYLISPEFEGHRVAMQQTRLSQATAILKKKVGRNLPHADVFARAEVCYQLADLGRTHQDSKSAYFYDPKIANAWTFKAEDFAATSGIEFVPAPNPAEAESLTLKGAILGPALLIRDEEAVWKFGFSSGKSSAASCGPHSLGR